MLAIMGLLGLALAASAFVDVSVGADEDELGPSLADDDFMSDHDMAVSFLSGAEGGVADSAGAGQDAPDLLDFATGDAGGDHSADLFEEPPFEEFVEGPIIARDVPEEEGVLLSGGDAADDLQGGLGDDTLSGGAGDDRLVGSTGDDHILAGAGDDTVIGGDGDDVLEGGEGEDALQGSYGDDTLSGGAGADLLMGGAGDDVLDGGDDADRDFLNGGNGDDRLLAGTGDHLNGGGGEDTFVLDDVLLVTVDDFDPDEDVIELAYDTNPPVLTTALGDGGVNLFADGELMATFQGIDTLDVDKSIRLVAA